MFEHFRFLCSATYSRVNMADVRNRAHDTVAGVGRLRLRCLPLLTAGLRSC